MFSSGQSKFMCPSCGEVNTLENCFRDGAVEYELRNSTLKCLNPSCPWEGESRFYQVFLLYVCFYPCLVDVMSVTGSSG